MNIYLFSRFFFNFILSRSSSFIYLLISTSNKYARLFRLFNFGSYRGKREQTTFEYAPNERSFNTDSDESD